MTDEIVVGACLIVLILTIVFSLPLVVETQYHFYCGAVGYDESPPPRDYSCNQDIANMKIEPICNCYVANHTKIKFYEDVEGLI